MLPKEGRAAVPPHSPSVKNLDDDQLQITIFSKNLFDIFLVAKGIPSYLRLWWALAE